jgi:hypothetical protein
LAKPGDVFDRREDWADLAEFAGSSLPGLRLAVVYGRRRQGKSYLLRRLAEASGGLYHLATEQTEAISLRRFGDSLASWQGLPEGSFGPHGWEQAFTLAMEVLGAGRSVTPPLLVLDEFPYLVHETPGLTSIVQGLYDRLGPGGPAGRTPIRLVLCGSAISVMAELLSGTKALRGRGALELRIKPFGFRDAREYWGVGNLWTAFMHNAMIGGTPGYRDLVADPDVPDDAAAMGGWVARNVLRPSAPLFGEAYRVIHEDPRIRDTATYSSVLATIAAGESSPTKIGGLLGRPATSLAHQLRMLESTGFVERRQDLLLDRRPVISVADPLVRLHHLVIEPYLADLEGGQAQRVWTEVHHTVESKIFGPHFEALAREWTARYAYTECGLQVGAIGQTMVSCREHKIAHEVDVLGLARGARPRTTGVPIAFVGEAKARDRKTGLTELRRLEHIRGHPRPVQHCGLHRGSGGGGEHRRPDIACGPGCLVRRTGTSPRHRMNGLMVPARFPRADRQERRDVPAATAGVRAAG